MRKIIFYVLFLLGLLGILGFSYISAYISEKPPLVSCRQGAFNSSPGEKYYAYPEKLVVQPWRGPHHVYAIFMIPSGYRSDGLFTVSIPGTQTYCGQYINGGKITSGVDEPKYYTMMRGYLNTRIALKLIAQGNINQLKQPFNWRLGYVKRK
ncbi:hypothetical protein IQ243_19425 [Nostocales cyanobacterium LEGE 11386]|nr:hypothetical protein [Nostocales cyanobacterium LEGE 11386]